MSKRVLIADDEPNIVISLEFLMKREGHAVSVARDGPAALEAIRSGKPDLVLVSTIPTASFGDLFAAVKAPALVVAEMVSGETLNPRPCTAVAADWAVSPTTPAGTFMAK